MNDLSHKAKDAAHKLDLGLRAYQGRIIDSNDKKNIVEIMENCIKDLEWDDFSQILNMTGGMYKDLLEEARANIKQKWRDDMAARVALPSNSPFLKKEDETPEEKEERIRVQERNFFFKKDPANSRCDCGAAFTQFPHIHSDFCDAHVSKVGSRNNNYWD